LLSKEVKGRGGEKSAQERDYRKTRVAERSRKNSRGEPRRKRKIEGRRNEENDEDYRDSEGDGEE
jgi:hypothetical protein